MSRFVNPFTDVGFKIIFGQDVSKPMLLHFLNTLLKGERVITNITFIDKEQVAEYRNDRSLIYDILCETDTKERIIVEMQNRSQPNFADRCLYYYSQAVSRQGEKGDAWAYSINAVYLIAFLNFRMDGLGDNLRTDVSLVNMQTGKVFSDKERFVFLQMPCFNKEAKECNTLFERWIYVLKNMAVLDRMPWTAKDMVFKRLAKIAEVRNLTKEERAQYDASLKHYRDSLNVMRGAIEEGLTRGRTEGYSEGLSEGLSKGHSEGLAEGLSQGLAEGLSQGRTEVAKKLKLMGMSLKDIMEATGLTEEEVEKA